MPFKYMMDFLRGKGSRLDRIEDRLRRIENCLSVSSAYEKRKSAPSEGVTEGPDLSGARIRKVGDGSYTGRRKLQKARTVYGPDGWCFTEEPETKWKLDVRDFGRDWVIEFDCPRCGKASSQGVKHRWVEYGEDHVVYHIRLDCPKCDWKNEDISIRAFE